LTILNGLRTHDDYFATGPDATGKLGFTSASIQMLAYGVVGDLIDEYFK
jgi:hypothetical protein